MAPISSPADSSSSPLPRPSRPHASSSQHPSHRRNKYLLIAVAVLLGCFVLAWAGYSFFGLRREPFNGPTWTAKREKLVFTILERGSLESTDNNDIICQLKARSPQSTLASTIRWVIDDGTIVKKGDLLMQLDDSGLVEQLKDKNIAVEKAESDWITADKQYDIVISQNESDIKNAINAVVLAKLDLQKYMGKYWHDEPNVIVAMVSQLAVRKSDVPFVALALLFAATNSDSEYQQTLQDVMGRIELAESDREGWLDRASWSKRMYKLQYISKTQADADQSKLDSAEYALKKVLTERQLLEITRLRTVTDLRNKLEEAYRNLDRTRTQANAKKLQAYSDRSTKKSIFDQESIRKKELQGEIDKCVITAPRDGLVVYYVSDQSLAGFGSKQTIIAQGESVIEGQKLLRIPDLTEMQVNTRVHEALITHVKVGQKAVIQIDAFPGTAFRGHVVTVANQPSQIDRFSSDIKVYQVVVLIDENLGGLALKPQMTARVTITADESEKVVLTVPIQSVFGTSEMGKKREVFVLDSDRFPHKREIEVGMNNDRMIEVVSGLQEGDTVVLNPASLLTGENSKMKTGEPKFRIDETGKSGKSGKKKASTPGGPGGSPNGPGPNLGAPPANPNANPPAFKKGKA